MKKTLARIFLWILQRFTVRLVKREHRHRFCNCITARIIFSTHYPRFVCEFSEPLTPFLREEFEQWRAECVAKFEEESEIKLRPEELEREVILTFPSPPVRIGQSPSRELYDKRNEQL